MAPPAAADLVVRSRRAVLPHGEAPTAVVIVDGRIAALAPYDAPPPARETVDLGELALLPGVVDSHVHCDDPGRAEWEGFETATRAAAAGGVTTLVDMPLNSIPATTDRRGLDAKLAAMDGRCRVDVALWGGVIPGNARELAGLAAAGVCGFKCFLSPSGVDEFPCVTAADLHDAAQELRRLGLPLLAHAEEPAALRPPPPGADPREYATWLAIRPPAAEVAAVRMLVAWCEQERVPVHIVHVAAAEVLADLDDARRRGLPITAETCPHYLTFAAEDIADAATEYKCAPPIRAAAHRERLWQALEAGTLDLIASDHSPCPPALKHAASGDFLDAWGGIASLEVSLRAIWTQARARGAGLADLARWMSAAPSRLAGLAGAKGAIAVGRDADLVAFDPDALARVDASRLHQHHPITPYAGRELAGRVHRTWLRGRVVFDDGAFPGAPAGRFTGRP